MKTGRFCLKGNSEIRNRAEQLLRMEDSLEVRHEWLLLAEEAAGAGDWLMSEYAYRKGLDLRVLW